MTCCCCAVIVVLLALSLVDCLYFLLSREAISVAWFGGGEKCVVLGEA